MLLTVTIGTPKYLCVQDNCLVIKARHEDKVLDKIPLCDIWVIIIDNPQVSITASLMGQVNDAGIGVLFCGSNHMPNGLALPIGAHSRHAEIVEHQLAISKPLRNQLWAKIVRRKIENQARALEFCGGKPCDVEKSSAMPGVSRAMTRHIGKVRQPASTSPNCFPTGRDGRVP